MICALGKKSRQWKLEVPHWLTVGWFYAIEMFSVAFQCWDAPMQLKWTAVGPWVGGLWCWHSCIANTHGHWVDAALSRWTSVSSFVSSMSAPHIHIPARRIWVYDSCEDNVSTFHVYLTWSSSYSRTYSGREQEVIRFNRTIWLSCSFHYAMFPPMNSEMSPLVMLTNGSPSMGAIALVTERYTSYTKYGTVFFQ